VTGMSLKLRLWFLETRPQFLLLSVMLVLLGTAVALHEGYFDWLKFFLTLPGLVLANTSVNVLNDYFDHISGIDFETQKTPFSGGSGILTNGLLKPQSVYKFGVACLALALLIGIYLTLVSGWQLLPPIILGGLVAYFYTSHLTRWPIGEFWAGLCMGTLPVLGTYFIQTGSYSLEALAASLPPGFLTTNLLLLNEFPDAEPDRKGGRRHLVITLGTRKASRLYAALTVMTYLCIVAGVVTKLMPAVALIALATVAFAATAVSKAFKYRDNIQQFIPALRANVITVLGTDALLALAYFLTCL
jgi:1,4-dihydroxy-2-naphthoate octaprenyltransferase